MNKAGKCWGCTMDVFRHNNVQINRIEIHAGGYCSEHKHEHKFNGFWVELGQLEVDVWKNDYDMVDTTCLSRQEFLVVAPGEYHRFRALTQVVAYEIYWTELEESDIQRKSCGGKD